MLIIARIPFFVSTYLFPYPKCNCPPTERNDKPTPPNSQAPHALPKLKLRNRASARIVPDHNLIWRIQRTCTAPDQKQERRSLHRHDYRERAASELAYAEELKRPGAVDGKA